MSLAERRPVGRSGLAFAPLAFGGNVFGWTVDEATSHTLLDRYADAGGNHVDTADVYSTWVPGHQGGESETIVGRWLARPGNRARMLVATKVGKPMGSGASGLSRGHIVASAEASLRRLRTDAIDLYYAHEDDPDTPLEESLEAFASLVASGKVRAIGASNYTAPRLARALATSGAGQLPAYVALQTHYNLVERPRYEAELEPLCRAEGLAVLPYYALAAGFLTGKYRTDADRALGPRAGRAAGYLTPFGLGVLAALDAVAAERGATPARVALAWLMARPGITSAIASATSVAQLDDLVAAAGLVLDADAIARLDEASTGGT